MSAGNQGPVSGSCKRRLLWLDAWGSLEDDHGICGGKAQPSCGVDGPVREEPASPPVDSPAAEPQQEQPYMLQSPIIDRAVFFAGRRKARVLFSPPTAQQQQEEDPQSPEPQRPAPQHQQQHLAGAYGVPPYPRQLSAAVSSSRASLDVLFSGLAERRAAATGSPATPGIAAAAPLPAPPCKDSPKSRRPLQAGRLQRTCRAARALPGLAPVDEAGLCHVRAWLSALEAR